MKGNAQESLSQLIKKYKINRVVWNRLYSKKSISRDTKIKQDLKEKNIEVETFNAHLLNEPWEVQNNSGLYFKVFTPYWRKAFDVYKKFAIKAKSTGDTMGRKMMMAPVGAGDVEFDFVYSLYANSPSEYGRNVDNFSENLQGCLLYTSPSPRDATLSRMPSSA